MNDYSPLFMACKGGNENLVKYLVELGADVNKENKFNETPLYCACRKGNEKIVKYLIEHGANVNRVNQYNET
jgi:ankyrin repeat protein